MYEQRIRTADGPARDFASTIKISLRHPTRTPHSPLRCKKMKNLRFSLCAGAVLLLAPTRLTQASAAATATSVPITPQALNEEARNEWADNIMKLSFKQDDTDEPKEKEAMRTCGQGNSRLAVRMSNKRKPSTPSGHRGLLQMIIDNTDADAKVLTVGQLSRDSLLIYSGNVKRLRTRLSSTRSRWRRFR